MQKQESETAKTTQQQEFLLIESPPENIHPKHWEEWSLSAVDPEIIRRNVRTLYDSREVDRVLNRNCKRRWKHSDELVPCWEVTGLDPLGWERTSDGVQIKPDMPLLDDKGKVQKYLGATDYGSAPLFLDNGLEDYWQSVLKDKSIPIIITEGAKKAGAGLTAGYATISIPGVSTCRKLGQLDRRLEVFAGLGRKIYLCFDNDLMEKQSVQNALWALGRELAATGAKVMVIELPPGEYKGMDNFLSFNAKDEFDKLVHDAETIEEWRNSLDQQWNVASRGRPIYTQSSLAGELAEQYRPHLAWHVRHKSWFWYSRKLEGQWSEVADEIVGLMVTTEAKNRMGATFKHDFVAGVIKFLKYDLAVENWEEAKWLIPLQDGVLDPVTMESLPHSPGYRFLWQLPYKWSARIIGCEPVVNWLEETMQGDRILVQLLRAYLKATVTGRCDLHRFLEAIGPGGTGKSTFLRLATDLVGKENTAVTSLKQLEGNRFETAALYGKRLVLITDSERYGGEVSVVKALTGQDEIRNERKNVQQTRGYTYGGMVMVAANEPIQSSDYSSGLQRRRLTVPFRHQIEPNKRRDLNKEFIPYLPGLLEWVLAMPEEEMESLVKDTSSTVRSLASFQAEFMLDTNPLADWFDNCVVLMHNNQARIGTLEKSADEFLYPSYTRWMESTGSKALSMRRFSEMVIDLCGNQLKIMGITKGRDNRGAYITGLTLRGYGMDDFPRPITGSDGLVTSHDESSDGSVTSQTRASDGSVECVGSISLQISQNSSLLENSEILKNLSSSSDDHPPHPSHPSLVSIPAVTDPSPVMSQSVTEQRGSSTCAPTQTAESIASDGTFQSESSESTVSDGSDESLKPLGFSLKVGDRIRCYPTKRHADSKWEVSATVTELETERGWFVNCTVEYCDKKKGITTVRIFGGCSNWILIKQ